MFCCCCDALCVFDVFLVTALVESDGVFDAAGYATRIASLVRESRIVGCGRATGTR